MFDYRLALMTGVDLPIPELQVALHQPTLKEISMIGEYSFFMGIQILCLNKKMYIQDEVVLSSTTNFQIFMTMLNDKQFSDKKESVLQVLSLILPEYIVIFTPRSMLLKKGEFVVTIDEKNFETLQEVLREQFCLRGSEQEEFNPKGKKAQEIANKILNARKKVAALKAAEQSGSVFAQYISVLTVGLGSMSLKDCLNLTMYQVYDLIERHSMYTSWDIDIKSRLAGAKGDKPLESWTKSIH